MFVFVGPLQRVRPRNGILALVLVLVVLVPLRSEFIGDPSTHTFSESS